MNTWLAILNENRMTDSKLNGKANRLGLAGLSVGELFSFSPENKAAQFVELRCTSGVGFLSSPGVSAPPPVSAARRASVGGFQESSRHPAFTRSRQAESTFFCSSGEQPFFRLQGSVTRRNLRSGIADRRNDSFRGMGTYG